MPLLALSYCHSSRLDRHLSSPAADESRWLRLVLGLPPVRTKRHRKARLIGLALAQMIQQ